MERKIELLLEQVGRPYEMLNQDDGTYQGCFYPIQFLYPHLKRYKIRSQNHSKNYLYGIKKIQKHCYEISPDDMKSGDIIVTKFRDVLHVGIYLDYGKVIHVFNGHKLQIGRLKMFKDFQSYRVR